MKKIEIFEAAMCCSTGVCGPSVDSELLRITNLFDTLKENEEVKAYRYNLTSNPQAFVVNEKVLNLIQNQGNDVLPITLIDGEILKTESYPISEELGLSDINNEKGACCSNSQEEVKVEANTSCCGGNTACC
ncbi:arsenite efflux transporter metallochaperone ArsD [Lactococcus cremoris]|jgi:hypothetical protein|uniref:Arsenite efflux transporter metallochaperone ArsD n=1 Tax=Lactococcus lactis subsp. cremoris TaxID=1359 RepID=A0AAX4AIJ6_LACLC|nr:arsenite efflux transporter metallochaperone ArsD [Lactococcus cremoris]KGH34451.1 arsenic resistance operon repressor [Lactococcus cremoris]QSE64551.1 arsenite efflux transporter metallochaperone ArsD [Lactococcus cremoris]WMX70249.1 arsenite efflux transporter metallochaperone ArsD [Lactococcus cremoris]